MAIGPDGAIYITDHDGYVFTIDAGGQLTVVAGTGKAGYAGDGGPAVAATFAKPTAMAWDAAGLLYVVDHENHRVRRVDVAGVITTVVGSGPASTAGGGFGGDGGPAEAAELNQPIGIAFRDGVLYIADASNSRIRAVDASGLISTIAGNGGVVGLAPLQLDGPVVDAILAAPVELTFDPAGELVFTDRGLNRALMIDTQGVLRLLAGNGASGFGGDGGPATEAQLKEPTGIAFDRAGNLYIADTGNQRIRRVDLSGVITTVAGTGKAGFSGDGGPATAAELHDPFGLIVDADGNLWFADHANGRVRRIDPSGAITTIAGGA